MIRLTEEQAEIYIPLHEDFTGATIEDCDYFYLAPSERGEGWEKVIYYTGRRWKDIVSDTEGSQYIYVLSNKSMPGIYKIGFTKGDPKKRAKQISSSTGVPQPFEVEFSFKCFNGLQLEVPDERVRAWRSVDRFSSVWVDTPPRCGGWMIWRCSTSRPCTSGWMYPPWRRWRVRWAPRDTASGS